MKLTAMALILFMVLGLKHVGAQEVEVIELTESDKTAVSQELKKEAESPKHDKKTKRFLKKVAGVFEKKEGRPNFFTRAGRTIGKGAAWVTTTTAKPFIYVAGFVTGTVQKTDKNRDVVELYKFFLNHQKEFDDLYRSAGTPQDMVELMLGTMEEIMERKSIIIMNDVLANLGIKRKIENIQDFELTEEELASIDPSKLDPRLVNDHPEFQEVKLLVGEVTKEELTDIVTSGYFDKSISFDNFKAAMPNVYELAGTVVGQVFMPSIALGIVSTTLSTLYVTPVLLADVGTAVSVSICLRPDNQDKFDSDDDLRQFCSYVTNRSSYQLMKSRAKGYVAGKNFNKKISEKLKGKKGKKEEEKESLVPDVQ